MANLLAVPSPVLGLMGRLPRQQNPLLQLTAADAGDEWFLNPQARPQGAGVPVLDNGQIGFDTTQPAQRQRVNPLNVLFRGLAPNLSGALDAERARLQMEADAPRMAMQAAENERIARALGPQALLSLRTNAQALGEGLSAQYKPTTTAAGGVSTVFGTGQQVEAPRVLEFGNDLVQAGPLSGVQTLGTRGPSYAEQAQIARVQQDQAQANARLGLDYQRLGQDQQQFEQRLGFDMSKQEAKPLTAQQSRQLEGYLQEIETASSINSELSRFDQMLSDGSLNLGPIANLQSSALNRLGISSPNSTNFAEFRSTLERLRNDSLRLNSGVQTEGDAQRAWNELISNINDEQVVRRQIKRISDLNERAIRFKEGRVSALESGQYLSGGRSSSGSAVPPLPRGFVLD